MKCDDTVACLGDHVVLQRGTTYKSALLDQPGPHLLGLASIDRNGGFRRDRLRTYGGESPEKLLLQPGDIYVALKDVTQAGDLLGAVARVPPDIPLGRLTQDTVKLEVKDGGSQTEYLYWLLRTPLYRDYCRAHSMGTTNLSLSRADFLACPVPPLTQDRSSLLRALDALELKIDSNGRLMASQEETIAAIFRARFVDFVGVEDFDETEAGRVPKGWTVAPIGDVVHVVGGGTPSTKEPQYWDGGTHCWVTPKDLSGLRTSALLDTARHITDDGLARISSGLLPRRTVLLSSRAPVGYTALAFVEVAVNQGFIAIPPNDRLPSEYVLLWLRENMNWIRGHAGGTTFAEISKHAFRPLPMIVPPADSLAAFERLARPVLTLIAALEREAKTLMLLRDGLLTKLVSGEIRVPERTDPEEVIGPATERLGGAAL